MVVCFIAIYLCIDVFAFFFFFFSSRRRHTRCREVSWARRCVQETGTWGFMPDFIADRLRYLDNSHNFFSIFAHDFVMNPDLARIFYIHNSPRSLHRLFRAFHAEYRANQINREEIPCTLR
eukprot:TRINITY_DN3924_c0_g1_i2.p1 TRINITY_DN3924_c0_g1~~TRINITY_DN3924_c0_g1_i2.p1  ORF type:complete len:121 (-),score=39.90 TRINITY_DN3924_c0_g1_i2:4-366(-)